jgi:hypothetical protein
VVVVVGLNGRMRLNTNGNNFGIYIPRNKNVNNWETVQKILRTYAK